MRGLWLRMVCGLLRVSVCKEGSDLGRFDADLVGGGIYLVDWILYAVLLELV